MRIRVYAHDMREGLKQMTTRIDRVLEECEDKESIVYAVACAAPEKGKEEAYLEYAKTSISDKFSDGIIKVPGIWAGDEEENIEVVLRLDEGMMFCVLCEEEITNTGACANGHRAYTLDMSFCEIENDIHEKMADYFCLNDNEKRENPNLSYDDLLMRALAHVRKTMGEECYACLAIEKMNAYKGDNRNDVIGTLNGVLDFAKQRESSDEVLFLDGSIIRITRNPGAEWEVVECEC